MVVTVLFGGSSYEHEISIVSSITIKKVLKKSTTNFIFCDANREFYVIDASNMKSNYFSSGSYKKAKKLFIKQGGFFSEGLLGSKPFNTGVVLNLIHGRDGEDGKMASFLEFNSIAYISPRLEASVLSFNKLYTKFYAQSVGVKTVPYQVMSRNDDRKSFNITYPVIIKPVRLGSSIGVSVVKSAEELDYALDVAFEFDTEVLLEPFLNGVKEYNQAGTKTTSGWELSIIEEPSKVEFLDFEKKYMDFSRDGEVGSADIDSSLEVAIQENFKKIYNTLFEGSIIRCDFFFSQGEVYLNEINPIPGSMANYLFKDFEGMVERLSKNLPRERNIKIDYSYIHSIQSAKGKA